jgi:hypothetical protein
MENPLVSFIHQTFNVNDIVDIKDTFNIPLSVPIWEPARIVNTTIELVKNDKGYYCIPPPTDSQMYQPKQKYHDMLVDLNCVSIQYISLKYIKNESKTDTFFLRHNFVPISGKDHFEKKCKAAEAAGRISNVCFTIAPSLDNVMKEVVMEPNTGRMEMQDYCIKTFMMIQDQNQLMNGITKIEPELCAKAQLPNVGQIYDEDGNSQSFPIDYYLLVPYDHILSWPLRCSDLWRKKDDPSLKKDGLFAINIEVTPKNSNKPYVPFYLVANQSFDKIMNGFGKEFIGTIDKRPLSDLQFEVLDKRGVHVQDAPVKLRIGVTFIAYPKDKPYPPFKPALDPKFCEYERLLQQKLEWNQFVKQQQEYKKRVQKVKK